MIDNEEYQAITKDIAGSRTKTRFTYEMYYGIKMIYDLYLADTEDFFVIFDYACDIEVGKKNGISFYQLKTKDGNFTLTSFLTKGRKENSIFQTLVNLDTSDCVEELVIVSNNCLHGINDELVNYRNLESFCFNDIPDSYKTFIESKITWPRGTSELNKTFFKVSDLCLRKPSNTLTSYTNRFLNGVFGGAPTLINRFEEVLICKVIDKANYDYDTANLNETITNKGITRRDVENILTIYHEEVINKSMHGIKEFSEKLKSFSIPFGTRMGIKEYYSLLFGCGYIKEPVRNMIDCIKSVFASEEYESLSDEDIFNKFIEESPIDYSASEFDEKAMAALVVYALLES